MKAAVGLADGRADRSRHRTPLALPAERQGAETTGVVRSRVRTFVKGQIPRPLWLALRQVALELQIARLHRQGVRHAARFRNGQTPLRLNLACGQVQKQGWINVDLFEPGADVHLDLRRPLPFRENAASYVYVEHFFEHLDLPNVTESMGWDLEGPGRPSEALQFLRECKRVLSLGGVLDIVVPDTQAMIEEPDPPQAPWWGPTWCDTHMHRLNYLFRQGRQHKYAYDEGTLAAVLRSVGFADIQRRSFDPTRDASHHAVGSLCMTARKAANL